MGKTRHETSGISFTGILATLFIGLKLGGVIHWSWWWVLSPLWVPLVIIALLSMIMLVIFSRGGMK